MATISSVGDTRGREESRGLGKSRYRGDCGESGGRVESRGLESGGRGDSRALWKSGYWGGCGDSRGLEISGYRGSCGESGGLAISVYRGGRGDSGGPGGVVMANFAASGGSIIIGGRSSGGINEYVLTSRLKLVRLPLSSETSKEAVGDEGGEREGQGRQPSEPSLCDRCRLFLIQPFSLTWNTHWSLRGRV